jgi:hypothetical protein
LLEIAVSRLKCKEVLEPTGMETSAAPKTARSTYALAVVTILLVGVLVVYFVQVSSLQGQVSQLQHNHGFGNSVVLFPRMTVSIKSCPQPPQGYCPNLREFAFPGNKSLQYPGYLNVTVYYSNASLGGIIATAKNPTGQTAVYYFTADLQPFPQVSPESAIVPMINGTTVAVQLINDVQFGTATFILRISYYY